MLAHVNEKLGEKRRQRQRGGVVAQQRGRAWYDRYYLYCFVLLLSLLLSVGLLHRLRLACSKSLLTYTSGGEDVGGPYRPTRY
jgi:hypothetical protein